MSCLIFVNVLPSLTPLRPVCSLSCPSVTIAVTLASTPLADGKPPVGRTQLIVPLKSSVLSTGLIYTDAQYTLNKLTMEMHCSELEKEREEKKEGREGRKEE